MPVLFGLNQDDLSPVLGVEYHIHPQGVFLTFTDRRQISACWKTYYLFWKLGYTHPPQALVHILTVKKLTLAVAESCTGGGICNALTDIPGASKVLSGGAVAYTPSAKSTLLGIDREELPPGCVDANLTLKMAENIKNLLGTDLALGITGALGPETPSDNICVGEVYLALAGLNHSVTAKFNFTGDRHTIKKAAIAAALNALLAYIARWYVA